MHERPPGHAHQLCDTPEPWCQDCYDLYTRQAALIYRHRPCAPLPPSHLPHHYTPGTTVYRETFYCPGYPPAK